MWTWPFQELFYLQFLIVVNYWSCLDWTNNAIPNKIIAFSPHSYVPTHPKSTHDILSTPLTHWAYWHLCLTPSKLVYKSLPLSLRGDEMLLREQLKAVPAKEKKKHKKKRLRQISAVWSWTHSTCKYHGRESPKLRLTRNCCRFLW